MPLHTLSCSSPLVPICPHSFVCCTGWPLCLSLLIRAHLHSFAGPRSSPPVCVHSVVLVPAQLCLSPLPGCACLAFACARWCLLGFVCAGLVFFRACLGFVMLIYALMGLGVRGREQINN